jgi:hypothetical protein
MVEQDILVAHSDIMQQRRVMQRKRRVARDAKLAAYH